VAGLHQRRQHKVKATKQVLLQQQQQEEKGMRMLEGSAVEHDVADFGELQCSWFMMQSPRERALVCGAYPAPRVQHYFSEQEIKKNEGCDLSVADQGLELACTAAVLPLALLLATDQPHLHSFSHVMCVGDLDARISSIAKV
jgi:hypothetical protein